MLHTAVITQTWGGRELWCSGGKQGFQKQSLRCSSHKNADEFTFAEFLKQHLVSLFPCQLMRNLSTYVAYCAFSLLAPLAVGSMLSTGKGEAREIVTRNKAQGLCIPTPCCFWWIILPVCYGADWALSVWTVLWRMGSDMFRAGADMTADLTRQLLFSANI